MTVSHTFAAQPANVASQTTPDHADDDVPAEVDFANRLPGKFDRTGMRLRLPIDPDDETQTCLVDRAQAKVVDVGALVNPPLKKDIELIEAAR